MHVLHPKILNLVHKYFSPSKEEVMEAREMLRLKEVAEKDGRSVAILNGKFIGPPMVATAKKILNKADLIVKK